MRVKIIKVSKTTLWYFDKVIGKYFYVDDNIIIDSQGYEGLTLTYNKGRYIYLEDQITEEN